MKKGRFIIDEQLPSLNEYINKCRTNPKYANAFKQKTEQSIGIYIIKACRLGELPAFGNTPCIVKAVWYEKKLNRDVDNIQSGIKFVLDALRKYKIIYNDNQEHVKQVYHQIRKSTSGKSYSVIELIECSPLDGIGML